MSVKKKLITVPINYDLFLFDVVQSLLINFCFYLKNIYIYHQSISFSHNRLNFKHFFFLFLSVLSSVTELVFYWQTSIRFSLSNEGETVLHPINEMKTRLERLVKLGKISFEVPLITGSAVMTDVSVVNISSRGTYDFLCHPYTSSTSAKTTSPQSTRRVESSTSKSQWL